MIQKKAKKHTRFIIFVAFLLVMVIAALIILEWRFGFIGIFKGDDAGHGKEGIVYENDELAIHFLELGNQNTGDCILIDIGDTEILIDAGSKRNSAETIVSYINKYCDDKVLEYVIATHAHEDHIAAFVGNSDNGIFDSFKCETIIDFPKTGVSSNIYNDYVSKRDAEVAGGALHYTALECWNESNGAQKTYQITDNISFSILYQKYYETNTSNENNYSVCILLTQGKQNFLFTGDLEKSGEESLVANNDLPECTLYKAGHHGSSTSSHDVLLAEIKPEIVCICTCAGTTEYTKGIQGPNTFPTQDFISRIGRYTDKVYVTTLMKDYSAGDYAPMNGNIVVVSDGVDVTVTGTKNSTKLKDTDWFKANRTWPSNAPG